jgi:GTP cyclohydrolase II
MRNSVSGPAPASFGEQDHIGADRGCSEFRSGRPILITSNPDTLLTLPIEGLTPDRFAQFAAMAAPTSPRLAVTARRARALGLDVTGPVTLALADGTSADEILSLATATGIAGVVDAVPAGAAAAAGIELAKLALGLPAVLVAAAPASSVTISGAPVLVVKAEAVACFRRSASRSLRIAADVGMPLRDGLSARFVVFSESSGGSVAVIIGKPDLSRPVPVRLHSACLTGDVFGSRRCDCGDQLRLSLAQLEAAGGGVILYLAQEGRGLGLANKIRAYKLQDTGLDTVDANTTLGFDDDERDYDVAASMLKILGCTRVTLLTNNPAKLDGLAENGIEICGRLPLVTPVHADNRRYLAAKAKRAGHRLEHVMDALAETDR